MANKLYGAVVASLSAVTLMLAPSGTFAASSGAGLRGSTQAGADRPLARRFGHPRHKSKFLLPGGIFYEPSDFYEPSAAVVSPPSNDVRYTYIYDVPWDWVHRFPPNVVPSDRPYVQSCPSEAVTVPDSDGEEQTVNIMRCY